MKYDTKVGVIAAIVRIDSIMTAIGLRVIVFSVVIRFNLPNEIRASFVVDHLDGARVNSLRHFASL